MLIIGGREISRPYQNVGYRLEKFDAAFFTNKSFYHQGFFAVKRRAVFILGAMWNALVRGCGVIVWLAAWKLVSNDAKRTVAPPNAKHSTLLQGCFLCFCFLFHSQFGNIA